MQEKDKCAFVDNEHDLDEMLKARGRLVALIFASWCPYCAKFLPVFERHAGKEGLSFLAIKDDQERMMDRYSVEVVPTVLFFENGKVSKRLAGARGIGLSEKQLTDFIVGC